MAANISKEDVIEYISSMTVLELSDFVKALEDKFGVSAAVPMAMAAAAPSAQAGEEGAAEKTEFDVVLTAVGDVPGNVKEGISKEEAEGIKGQLEGAGATAEIK